jgi:hypothetical protein
MLKSFWHSLSGPGAACGETRCDRRIRARFDTGNHNLDTSPLADEEGTG